MDLFKDEDKPVRSHNRLTHKQMGKIATHLRQMAESEPFLLGKRVRFKELQRSLCETFCVTMTRHNIKSCFEVADLSMDAIVESAEAKPLTDREELLRLRKEVEQLASDLRAVREIIRSTTSATDRQLRELRVYVDKVVDPEACHA